MQKHHLTQPFDIFLHMDFRKHSTCIS